MLFVQTEKFFDSHSVRDLPLAVWQDSKDLLSSPRRFRPSDLRWLVPLAAASGLLVGTDHHIMTLIHTNASSRRLSDHISDAGLAAFAGSAAASYGIGLFTHNDHLRETGRLSVQALADTFLATEALKVLSARERPLTDASRGIFGQASPFASSFPSQHAALAWTTAAIIAREYPGAATTWGSYGLAAIVSLSRITAEKHFPSDVLIGAAAGYLIGRFVYRTQHDDRQSDRVGSIPTKPAYFSSSKAKRPATASPFVPLDSWIYLALKRLAALGYIPDQTSNLMPWTRAECLRQTEEAADFEGASESPSRDAVQLIRDLKTEFTTESEPHEFIRLESLYTRFTQISGTPLRDSYHFGQTITNDYGRPYDRGLSNITGFSAYAASGPFFSYFRGEYQYAPGRAADPPSVRQFIADADSNPLQPATPLKAVSHFQPQEMYAGVKLGFENITFGRQNLWWGPGEESAFSFSTNAQPFYTLRLSQAQPLMLPGPFRLLGRIRTEFIAGKLSGHAWPPRPYLNAQKISLDLTDNFEVGFSRSGFFGGVGHPLTISSLTKNLISFSSTGDSTFGARNDPGDRHSGFDFRYRIPGLRRYVTVYSDSYADDEPSPIDNPKRSAWAPGLYLAQLPGLRKLDFRFETYATLLYRKDEGGQFLYYNDNYHDSYTQNGYLLGSWIGRDSRAYVASVGYWVSARSRLQARYSQIKASSQYLPGGGTQSQGSVIAQWSLTPEWLVSASVQYERYFLPVLGPARRDLSSSLQITFTPRGWAW